MERTDSTGPRWGRVSAWLVTAVAGQTVVIRVQMLSGLTAPLRVLEVLCLSVLVMVCVDTVRRGLRPRHVDLFLAVAVVHEVANLGVVDGATGADQPGSFLYAVQAIATAALLCQRRRFAIVAVVVAGVHVASRTPLLGGTGVVAAVDEMITVIGTGIALLYLLRAIAVASEQAAQARALSDRVDRLLDDDELARRAEERVRRILHDEVIGALVTIPRADPEVARRAAAGALTALREARTGHEWVLGGHRGTPVMPGMPHVSWVIQEGFSLGDWPRDVVSAMAGAAAEALRNVAQHSGVDEATVTVTHGAGALDVLIEDRGVGLPAGDRVEGFGISSSIRGRMSDVGGVAALAGAGPVAGTSVRLSWSAPSSRGRPDSWAHAFWSVDLPTRGVSSLTVVPLLAFTLAQQWLALRYVARNEHPWVGVGIALTLAVWTVLVVVRGSAGPLRPRLVLGWLTFVLVAVAVGLWAAGPGSLLGFESWVVGCGTPPLLLLGLVAPRLWAIAGAVGLSAVVLGAAVLDPTLAPVDVPAPITGPLVQVGMVMIIGGLIRRSGAVERREAWSFATAAIDDERVRAHTRELLASSTDVGDLAGPFLRAVASGSVTGDDAGTALEASLLAHAVRDELNAPGLADTELRRAILAARRRGVVVTIRPVELGSGRTAAIRRALESALDRASAQHAIVVSGHRDDRVKIVVRPAWTSAAEDVGSAPGRIRWSMDADAAWAVIPQVGVAEAESSIRPTARWSARSAQS